MAYQVLYRKYRPSTFDEVVGQEYIIKTIKNAINRNELSHAYLFCGPRGTGKTSLAKLLAKTINCESEDKPCGVCKNCKEFVNNTHPDIMELDAASNNSVEDIRNIVESVKYPAMMGKYKVYIIDEVHMLSPSAFNALLKTLEEPPSNVIFILATTEPQKIIQTVLSRCQRYNFSKISSDKMKKRVLDILEKEEITYDESAVDAIVELSDGGMRDVLSILEQVLSYGNNTLKEEDVLHIYGLLRTSDKVEILKKIRNDEINNVITHIREMYHNGVDINRLTQDFVKIFKEVLLYKVSKNQELLKFINKDEVELLSYAYNEDEIIKDIDILIKTIENYRNTSDVLSYLEIALLKIASNNIDKLQISKQKSEEIIKKEVTKSENINNDIKNTDKNIKVKKDIEIRESIFDEPIEEVPEIIQNDTFEEIDVPDDESLFETVELNLEELLSLLVEADRDEKMNDMIIYHRLVDYSFEPTKRRFFNLLKESEIFASHKDAIIFRCKDKMQMNQINDLENNKALYSFLCDEYQIDKMVFAIDDEICLKLVDMFHNKEKYNIKKVDIKRYSKETNEISFEQKLTDLFGDVKVEE